MKVAVSSEGPGMDARASKVFGRCPYFVIVEIEGGEAGKTESIPNPASGQQRGAGIMAAQELEKLGANAIISGNIGPKAFSAINTLGIDAYLGAEETVKENIDAFMQGKLPKASGD
ncbi:dinitrogenase iron-molybdenum cofactor biosynthesis protein [Candidatus Micrarchaeota archaeon]|nr:dinitrogenase iron-molybdenum cofactor biosynthesis protein [Candidatus Micrarchaeota archaeon]